MHAIITVGLGFGDEGKGATVDYLVRKHRAAWVVRYSGGAQAGHNVELPEPLPEARSAERRHTFSQFGAGAFAGAGTYIGPRVILCPAALENEAEHLRELGVLSPLKNYLAHPDCLISTIYHIAVNRLRELARGDDRHGSCGLGMGESRQYWLSYPDDAVVAADLHDLRTLRDKLERLQQRLMLQTQRIVDQSPRPADKEMWENMCRCLHDATPAQEADQLQQAAGDVMLSRRLPQCETAIFEGAQGVLLDEWLGFHPYTTWSTVTAQHALELLSDTAPGAPHETTVLGVTRAYATRHGAGPFPTGHDAASCELANASNGNPENHWQGSLRVGPLDMVLLRYAAKACPVDGLVVNGLDQLPVTPTICRKYDSADGGISELTIPLNLQEQSELTQWLESVSPRFESCSVNELLEELSALSPIVIEGRGPTFQDRHTPFTSPRRSSSF